MIVLRYFKDRMNTKAKMFTIVGGAKLFFSQISFPLMLHSAKFIEKLGVNTNVIISEIPTVWFHVS